MKLLTCLASSLSSSKFFFYPRFVWEEAPKPQPDAAVDAKKTETKENADKDKDQADTAKALEKAVAEFTALRDKLSRGIADLRVKLEKNIDANPGSDKLVGMRTEADLLESRIPRMDTSGKFDAATYLDSVQKILDIKSLHENFTTLSTAVGAAETEIAEAKAKAEAEAKAEADRLRAAVPDAGSQMSHELQASRPTQTVADLKATPDSGTAKGPDFNAHIDAATGLWNVAKAEVSKGVDAVKNGLADLQKILPPESTDLARLQKQFQELPQATVTATGDVARAAADFKDDALRKVSDVLTGISNAAEKQRIDSIAALSFSLEALGFKDENSIRGFFEGKNLMAAPDDVVHIVQRFNSGAYSTMDSGQAIQTLNTDRALIDAVMNEATKEVHAAADIGQRGIEHLIAIVDKDYGIDRVLQVLQEGNVDGAGVDGLRPALERLKLAKEGGQGINVYGDGPVASRVALMNTDSWVIFNGMKALGFSSSSSTETPKPTDTTPQSPLERDGAAIARGRARRSGAVKETGATTVSVGAAPDTTAPATDKLAEPSAEVVDRENKKLANLIENLRQLTRALGGEVRDIGGVGGQGGDVDTSHVVVELAAYRQRFAADIPRLEADQQKSLNYRDTARNYVERKGLPIAMYAPLDGNGVNGVVKALTERIIRKVAEIGVKRDTPAAAPAPEPKETSKPEPKPTPTAEPPKPSSFRAADLGLE